MHWTNTKAGDHATFVCMEGRDGGRSVREFGKRVYEAGGQGSGDIFAFRLARGSLWQQGNVALGV